MEINVSTGLVETDGVEAEAEVEEADGGAVEEAEEDDGLRVDGLRLEEPQPLCHVQRAVRHQQVPARQRRRCSYVR